MKEKKKLVFVLGIRPDIIRASLILEKLENTNKIETIFIWSGQHYSDNLKGIFFRELNVKAPDIDLGAGGQTDAETVSAVIDKLYRALEKIKPDAVVFLGDTNTVVGSIAAAMLNIPVVHIEGCMRSYDWRMPEEKYRTTIDHLADLIYAYFDEYKEQGVREGLNPKNIVVVGNPIVDILERFYFKEKKKYDELANANFFKKHGLEKNNYLVLTTHRRENVHNEKSFRAIMSLVAASPYKVFFPASYRTQKVIKELAFKLPQNLIMVEPIGYEEILMLLVNSKGVLTDSGTVVEEASILNVPSVQMRKSTERPQVYDAGSSVKFDPDKAENYPAEQIYNKLDLLYDRRWKHNLGDGKTSERIAADLVDRLLNEKLRGHKPEDYHIPIWRSYREDDIKI